MIKEALIFIGGAACGFAAATLILRDRYKTMVDEEVQSVLKWANEKATEKKPETRKEVVKKVEKLTEEYKSDDGKNDIPEDYVEPYHISAEEYEDDSNGYDKISLDYYLQGEGLYEGEIPVDDIEETVGSDNLVRLHGDVNAVYVRNENTKIDYEVVGIDGRFGAY